MFETVAYRAVRAGPRRLRLALLFIANDVG